MIPEANRLQAVLPLRDVTIGIAGGFPIRIGALDRNVQSIQRGHRLPMPLVSNIVARADEVTIVGGIPGQRGMLAILNPVTLITGSPEIVGQDCLSGAVELGDLQAVVNAKGVLFSRRKGKTWTEQPAHQGACTGMLKLDNHTFVTYGVDGLVHIWDSACTRLGTLEGHVAAITSGIISAAGNLTTVSTDRSVRIWDPVRQRQKMFFKGFDNALVAVHQVAKTTVVIDSSGQVFTLTGTGKIVRAGAAPGYPCCSWIVHGGEASVYVAQRGGMIHRIPIGV
jgi:hypothetical protein